jgi:N-acetylglucosamine-6-sulfatase
VWRGLAVIIAGLAIAIALFSGGQSQSLEPALDLEPKPGPENVVLIVTDDQHYEMLKTMPYLSSRKDWFEFNEATYNYPLCCPSRATILSGLYSHHSGVERNKQSENFPEHKNIAKWLSDADYQTALFGKYFNNFPWGRGKKYIPPHWDRWLAYPTKARYYDSELNDQGRLIKIGSKQKDHAMKTINQQALNFSREAKSPFFLYYAPPVPHAPYQPEPKHRGKYDSYPVQLPPNFNEKDVSDKPQWIQNKPLWKESALQAKMTRRYRRQQEMLLSADDFLKELDLILQQRNLYEKTMVIFMSDNGFSFGSHRFTSKVCPYQECLKMPLLVRYPGYRGWSDQLVSNIDIAPTILDALGLKAPDLDGESLIPIIKEEETLSRDILFRQTGKAADYNKHPDLWGIRTERFKYIEYTQSGERELYDLLLDPYELTNQADNSFYALQQADLKERLQTLRER